MSGQICGILAATMDDMSRACRISGWKSCANGKKLLRLGSRKLFGLLVILCVLPVDDQLICPALPSIRPLGSSSGVLGK